MTIATNTTNPCLHNYVSPIMEMGSSMPVGYVCDLCGASVSVRDVDGDCDPGPPDPRRLAAAVDDLANFEDDLDA